MPRKLPPLEFEQCSCVNPECGEPFRKMKGSPVKLCVSCMIHPNLVAPHPVRDQRETAERRDF